MRFGRRLRQLTALGVIAGSLGLATIASPGSVGAATATITYAEGPGANPNYIFPFMDCTYFSVNNVNQFQHLMYRPLYWFGLGGSSAYVPALSVANQPVFTNGDKTVTITMKGWRFASGQLVNARSVMFFLNMYKADPASYCGYNSGYGIPDQVRSATGSLNRVTITFKTPVNPNWLLYNYLSEITPLPDVWDRASGGRAANCAGGAYGAASTKSACKGVETYLAAQSSDMKTFTNALWQLGVDGPWRLTKFDGAGNATFQPNSKYSGPVKAKVQYVKEVAYNSSSSEVADLQAGRIDIGYVDPLTLGGPSPAQGKPGPNAAKLAGQYKVVTGSPWSFNFAQFNLNPNGPKSSALSKLYIRQALQLAVNQPSIIANVYKGYGYPTNSPLPPGTPTALSAEVTNPYPFNLARARSLLVTNGWTMSNGVMTCTSPGAGASHCGTGIVSGYTLSLKLVWVSDSPLLDQAYSAEIADWTSLGIQLTHSTASFASVANDCGQSGSFDICALGGGWTYSPNYYPSGESLFLPGGQFNVGSFNDARMTNLINATISAKAKLSSYAILAAQQLPVLYEPQSSTTYEILKTLKSSSGFVPSPLGNFMPEYYSF